MAAPLFRLGAKTLIKVGKTADKGYTVIGKVGNVVEKGGKVIGHLDRAGRVAHTLYRPRSMGTFPAGALAAAGAAEEGAGGVAAPMPLYLPGVPGIRFPAYCECEEERLEPSGKSKEGTWLYKCHGCQQSRRTVFPNDGDGAGAAGAAAPAAAAPAARRAKSRSRSRGSSSERNGAGAAAGAPPAAQPSIAAGVKARTDRRKATHAASAAGPAQARASAKARPGGKFKGVSVKKGRKGVGASARRPLGASRKRHDNDSNYTEEENGNSSNNNAPSGGGLRRFTRKLRKSK